MQIIPEPAVLLIQGLGFLLVLGVFAKFLWKPILGILETRKEQIQSEYDSAESARTQAAELKADYEKHIASIEEEMRTKIAEAVKDGQTMREEILSESRAKADEILEKAQAEISREREAAVADLKNTVATLAVGAAGRIIEETLDAAKHSQIIDQFVDDLGGVRK